MSKPILSHRRFFTHVVSAHCCKSEIRINIRFHNNTKNTQRTSEASRPRCNKRQVFGLSVAAGCFKKNLINLNHYLKPTCTHSLQVVWFGTLCDEGKNEKILHIYLRLMRSSFLHLMECCWEASSSSSSYCSNEKQTV